MGVAASEVGEAQTDGAAAAEASNRLRTTCTVSCMVVHRFTSFGQGRGGLQKCFFRFSCWLSTPTWPVLHELPQSAGPGPIDAGRRLGGPCAGMLWIWLARLRHPAFK